MLTQESVRELLDYGPVTGALTWRPRARHWFLNNRQWKNWNQRYPGAAAGSITHKGYLRVHIVGHLQMAHRLIWLWMTGVFPNKQVDHKNRDRADNRWDNLRLATNAENCRNKSLSRNNATGFCGVSWNKLNGRWMAYIRHCGVQHHLGQFETFEQAVAARQKANRDFGFDETHGREAA